MKLKNALRTVLPLLVMSTLMLAQMSRADSLDSSVLRLFPRAVGQFAYVDLDAARQFPWFAQFGSQTLPISFFVFQDFLAEMKIIPASQIDGLAWAEATGGQSSDHDNSAPSESNREPEAEEFVGVAQGHFDVDSAEATLNARNLQTVQLHGYTLYTCGGGAGVGNLFFVFIDSNTAAFGDLKVLERVVAVHSGQQQSLLADEDMMPLINEANGKGTFWSVLNPAHARHALEQLVPFAASFSQSSRIIGSMNAVLMTVKTPMSSDSGSIDTDFQAVMASPENAATLSQLLQAGLLVQQYQANHDNPDLAQMLESMAVSARSDRLDISFSLTNDQIISLIAHNTFVPAM